ncbi:MAG: SDR family oxidoreductase [Dehalococcoidales bacterium]|nr:SDR family oxidoreductase [Dehalococcoidales bacterium]
MSIDKLFDISGKKALVTGAARGIGKVLATVLAEAGCDVSLVGLHLEGVKELADELSGTGIKCVAFQADVGNREEVEKAFDATKDAFGRLDICVNNAGVSFQMPLEDMPEDEWDNIMNTNMKGLFFCSQAAAKIMIPQKSGSIINIGSISARAVNVPQKQAVYNSSKAGVVMLSKSMALEWAEYGIRVNSISPGYMKTEMTIDSMSHLFPEWESITPIGRLGEPEELRGAVIFLASDASSYMIGHDLVIDGGYTIR